MINYATFNTLEEMNTWYSTILKTKSINFQFINIETVEYKPYRYILWYIK